jgi:hypothetical protein
MKKPTMPPKVLAFFQKTGSEGSKARATRHSASELSKWGKLGGRPKGSKDKQPRKGGKGAK